MLCKLFYGLKMLNAFDVFRYHVTTFMHKYINGLLPSIYNIFTSSGNSTATALEVGARFMLVKFSTEACNHSIYIPLMQSFGTILTATVRIANLTLSSAKT